MYDNDQCKYIRAPYNSWNKETMQKYLDDNNFGYVILDAKHEKKEYGWVWAVYVKCPNKNHEPYWVDWKNLTRGCLCKECHYEKTGKTKWTQELAYEYVKNSGFVMLNKDDFKNVDKPFPCYDDNKFIYMINITNLKKYNSGERKYFSMFQFNSYAIYNVKQYCKLYRPDYDILSTEYNGTHSKYEFYYYGQFDDNNQHNRKFIATIDSFIFGNTGHPDLTKSNGERSAELILKKHNIHFIPQKRYDDCKDKYTLPFDFYLPEYNLIIEIMGEQHEKPVPIFGGEEKFQETVRHDKMKRDYLKIHNIDILDIWYYDFKNMEDIILNKLNSINNIKLLFPVKEVS